MADRGILFSAPMVRALLDGRKTQTRRLLNPQPPEGLDAGFLQIDGEPCPRITHGRVALKTRFPHAVGDRLWVRESWYCDHSDCQRGPYLAPEGMSHEELVEHGWLHFMATNNPAIWEAGQPPFKPSIHMPRWASRLWLTVTDVRVQRLQDISEADAVAEGIPADYLEHIHGPDGYRDLWDSLHTDPGTRWADNPWIYALTFTVHRGNIDG